MSTETFLRLPEEKRRRFLDAAWEEFTRARFADASINKIVQRAGIPRGSFYQYFLDKTDLFSYLLNEVKQNYIQVFQGLLEQTGGDLFQVHLEVYDLIAGTCGDPPPMLERCVRILRINPGLDLRKMVAWEFRQDVPRQLLERTDVSALRQRDPDFVRRVFCLATAVLGVAVMDTLLEPERRDEHRREMERTLELVKWGSLRQTPPELEGGRP